MKKSLNSDRLRTMQLFIKLHYSAITTVQLNQRKESRDGNDTRKINMAAVIGNVNFLNDICTL
jgi:hypothetical protein